MTLSVFTHIGDACRAAGLLPIAMPFSVRHSIAAVESEPARTPTFATGCYGEIKIDPAKLKMRRP